MGDSTIFYCISDKGSMIPLLIRSLQGLSRFRDRDDILVWITPPHGPKNLYEKNIGKYAKLDFKKNITEPFWANKNVSGRWGEIFQTCFVPYNNVIYIDHDTMIFRDLFELLDGDYDVSFRVAGTFYSHYDPSAWTDYFKAWGKTPIPMPNGGFVIFKNKTHEKIRKQVLEVFNDLNIVQGLNGWCNKDEIALAVASSGLKIRWMDKQTHCFRWKFEVPFMNPPYVIHGDFNPRWISSTAWHLARVLNSILIPQRFTTHFEGFPSDYAKEDNK